jgi:uncharacterized membrane protein YgdD (TMEM256/DUF423 family)
MAAMQPTTSARLAAVFGGLAVALGAFGAHAMQDRYDAHTLDIFEKAVRYQMYHALALGLCAALGFSGRPTRAAAISFVTGIVLFSGSLYALVFTGTKTFGAVTPFGGVAFLVGWTLLAWPRRATATTPPAAP